MGSDLQAFKNDLTKALGGMRRDRELLYVKCDYLFEPHGKASETWEECWTIRLPNVRGYVHGPNGWYAVKANGMTFTGRSFPEALRFASAWLITMNNQGLKPEWADE